MKVCIKMKFCIFSYEKKQKWHKLTPSSSLSGKAPVKQGVLHLSLLSDCLSDSRLFFFLKQSTSMPLRKSGSMSHCETRVDWLMTSWLINFTLIQKRKTIDFGITCFYLEKKSKIDRFSPYYTSVTVKQDISWNKFQFYWYRRLFR